MKFNITQVLAQKSGKHPKTVIGIWALILVVSLVLVAFMLTDTLTTETTFSDSPESVQADNVLNDRLDQNGADETNEMVIIKSDTLSVEDPAFQTYTNDIFDQLMGLGPDVVLSGVNYYQNPNETLVSKDGHALIIPLILKDKDVVAPIHSIADRETSEGEFEVLVTGDATIYEDTMGLAEEVLRTGESIGILMALVILAVVFGALASALLPITLAIVSVVISLGLAVVLGQAIDLFFFLQNMVTMMGLAVGIDYSLFILTRYREERARGLDKIQAITIAGATSGRAVLFSGMTVVLALVGLVIFPLNIFWSAGIGAMLVVVVAVLASSTLLPALLGLLGDKVNKFRLPSIRRSKPGLKNNSEGGFWATTTRIVMRRPVVSLVLAAGLLLVLATPFLDLNKGMTGTSTLPDNLRSKQGYIALQQNFGFGEDAPAIVVIDGKTDSPEIQKSVTRLQALVQNDPAFSSSWVETHPEANLTVFYAHVSGDSLSKNSMDAVTDLRHKYIPQAFMDAPAEVKVTGNTAGILDFNATTDTYTPKVFLIVLGLSFVILTVAFRSVVIPVTSILMNLLSVGAAYGMIVLVFQKGICANLLGFRQVDMVESWLPLFLFAILFGLSMDYHVFLLSRVKEKFMETGSNSEAVAFGLRSTGKLITGAALIMVAVFGGFALGDMAMFQQMGFGLGVAVLIDATIVRSILVPSTMRILGQWNWYFPKWLEWIPSVYIGEPVQEKRVVMEGAQTRSAIPQSQPVLAPLPVQTDTANFLVRCEVQNRHD